MWTKKVNTFKKQWKNCDVFEVPVHLHATQPKQPPQQQPPHTSPWQWWTSHSLQPESGSHRKEHQFEWATTCNYMQHNQQNAPIHSKSMEQPLRLAPCFIGLSGGDDTIPRMAHISLHCTVARTLRTHACTHAHSRICSLETQPHAVVTRKLCHRQIDGRIRMHRRILRTTVHNFTK